MNQLNGENFHLQIKISIEKITNEKKIMEVKFNIKNSRVGKFVLTIPLVRRMCSWGSGAFEGRLGNADSAVEAAGAGTGGEGGRHLR